jgi:HEPN domain-containing protein
LAVEKSLKAVIAKDCVDGEIPPKWHDLMRLAEKANLLTTLSEEQKSLLRGLNPLNIEARYPEYKNKIAQTISEEFCVKLIAETEEFLCWIKKQL